MNATTPRVTPLILGFSLFLAACTDPETPLDQNVSQLQQACEDGDSAAATTLTHPAIRGDYAGIFEEHAEELPRLGRLLATRRLLKSNANLAEYEVTEDGETFIVTFERFGEEWFLRGL